MRRKAEG